jgi:hypothetical protein
VSPAEMDALFLERIDVLGARKSSRGISIGSRIDRSGNCWIWQGPKIPGKGYGVVWFQGKYSYLHRIALQITSGLPAGMMACHHCDNPPCCRPSHLFAGTQRDNIRDSIEKGRQSHGEAHRLAVYSDDLVRRAVELLRAGVPICDAAAQTGITYQALFAVASGQSRKDITGGRVSCTRALRSGERAANAKLTDARVAAIRGALTSGITGAALAREYGVNEGTISRIKSGKIWRHVNPANDSTAEAS